MKKKAEVEVERAVVTCEYSVSTFATSERKGRSKQDRFPLVVVAAYCIAPMRSLQAEQRVQSADRPDLRCCSAHRALPALPDSCTPFSYVLGGYDFILLLLRFLFKSCKKTEVS